MSKFYTRSGDDGYTGLLGEGRVPKYHILPETFGDLDEATAALGLARASCQAAGTPELLLAVQRDLYAMMAEIAATPENAARFRVISDQHVAQLEAHIDRLGEQVEVPTEFILPGDSPAGGVLSLARAIVRRAERHVTRLVHTAENPNPHLLPYLNRLSSLLFILELLENKLAGHASPTLAKGNKPG